MKLLLAAALSALAVAGGGSPQVVARTADGEAVASLPVGRGFALEYVPSYDRRPPPATFRVVEGGF